MRVTPGANGKALRVEWTPPPGSVTGYTVQWKSGTQGYDSTRTQEPYTATRRVGTTITGLGPGTQYTVRVLYTTVNPYYTSRFPDDYDVLGEATGTPGATRVVVDGGGSVSVERGWRYIPNDDFIEGRSFRLLFVTSTTRDGTSSDIADYNAFVQGRAAANGHLADLSGEFRALASTTEGVDARDNTATVGAGVPVYWLGGEKVADDYADLYDGSWDSGNAKTETGGGATGDVWTGTNSDGTKRDGLGGGREHVPATADSTTGNSFTTPVISALPSRSPSLSTPSRRSSR